MSRTYLFQIKLYYINAKHSFLNKFVLSEKVFLKSKIMNIKIFSSSLFIDLNDASQTISAINKHKIQAVDGTFSPFSSSTLHSSPSVQHNNTSERLL